MKLPMKRKIVGLANGRNVSPAGATCRMIAQGRSEQRGHRERQRLGDPEHDDQRHDGGQAVCLRTERRERPRQHEQEEERAGDDADLPPLLIESELGL